MNKRRQIADSNPKNLTHFSGNSMSSSGTIAAGGGSAVTGIGMAAAGGGINRSPINSNPEHRSAKSIIIGAGQPIIVPGQQNNPTIEARANANQLKSNVNLNTSTILSKVNSDAIASIRSSFQSEHHQNAPTTTLSVDTKVTVEEFCPDGGTLDKGFLDDLPGILTNADVRPLDDNCDSDSDSNDIENPLVAKFHEDPFDDLLTKGHHNPVTMVTPNAQKSEPKINPLAKNKNKSPIVPDLSVILTPTSSKRRSSNSSEDIEIPHILKTKAADSHGSDAQSNEEFDWLSDSNQRHSPDGVEDESSLPSIDKTVRNSSSLAALSISENETSKLDRLQLNDGDGEGEMQLETEPKEKSSKSKKKKKDKKEKKEKKHGSSSSSGGGGGDKEKKRTKSKKSTSEDLLSENIERPSHSDRYEADDDQYEAL